ncbi:MAG: PepSY domain-containing protein [Bacteroidetes bacterium]|jgi:hypothetical protein|nr:PepSY domain-containing protein [Bacteroidota bacterium]
MKLNNRNISNQFRVLHRYLGFFLSGIMFMYALTGITLTYRDKDTFKTEVVIERQIEKGLASAPEIRGAKNLEYNAVTGDLKYIQMQPPKFLGMMEKMHKATSSTPLFFLNILFGVGLLFFVVSAYWMFLPQTDVFKKALYFTLAGIVLSAIMILV